MYTPFQLLTSGNIKLIPAILSRTNVNNKLNIFEALCSLIPQQ
ncbi:hypothetical protein [Rickettsia rickettsii]|nr:hypothetical protein [Rickettsia rickettsii]WGQ94979.1 hypothetical protein QBX69_04120 [Rickettsia rickettsii str. 'Sheila Smith']